MIYRIDPVNGDNNAIGDKEHPLKSYDEYMCRCPNGKQAEPHYTQNEARD
jgi:hypothetical protein